MNSADFTVVGIGESLAGMHEFLQYVLVFVFAAIPWIEIAVVIPIALGLGIHPLFVAGLTFAGNLGSVLLLLKCMPWIPRLRTRSDNDRDSVEKKRRTAWGWWIWDRYGLAGLAIAAPVVTGVHLAALMAIVVDTERTAIAQWMTISIAGWTIFLVVGTLIGLNVLGIG